MHRTRAIGVAFTLLLAVSAIAMSCDRSNILQVKPRKAAPGFTAKAVINEKFENLSLSDYEGKWFSDRIDEFRALNTEVAAISTGNEGGLGAVKIPVIADISKQISESYGVLVEDPEDDMYGAALRALFIIDPKGVIRSVQINDDAVGRSVDETMRLIQAFQFADSHDGEVCPVNWQPGDATMKADPNGSKEYFHKMYDKEL